MLKDKVILITGANGGLGNSVTNAALAAGAKVAGLSRKISKSEFDSPDFEPFEADIATRAQADAIVQSIHSKWGRLDALVHLVGGFAAGDPFATTREATFDSMFHINVRAFVLLAQAVLPGMQQQHSGSIVAIGARPAIDPVAGMGAYAASKAALISLVRTIAVENKELGITANVVIPGAMDTPANRAAMPNADPATFVRPQQVAELLMHLCSANASQLSGALIPIYGASL